MADEEVLRHVSHSVCRFTVRGVPQQQGSTRAFAVRKGGLPTGQVVVTSDNASVADWKQQVASVASAEHGDKPLWTHSLAVDLRFAFSRPAGHFGSGRNAALLRPSAPVWPAVRPDLDKLVRAVLDALTGTVWRDDAQVVTLAAKKVYGTPPGVMVTVIHLAPLERK